MMQTKNIPESLSTELQQRIESVQNTLNHIQSTFFPAALASSLSIEDMVLTDLILRHSMNIPYSLSIQGECMATLWMS
jgi:hypothetical protein